MSSSDFPNWHGTTIIGVKKEGKVVIAGDGQVSLGQTVIKGSAKKVRKLSQWFDVFVDLPDQLQTLLLFWNA